MNNSSSIYNENIKPENYLYKNLKNGLNLGINVLTNMLIRVPICVLMHHILTLKLFYQSYKIVQFMQWKTNELDCE